MNKSVLAKKILFRFIFSGAVFFFALQATAVPAIASMTAPGLPVKVSKYDTIVVNKFPGSRKSSIRLFPDAQKQVLLVSANSRQEKHYQFYMFDMDGNLIAQAAILNRETTVLNNILKGNYLFEIFSNDERIENGQLTIK